MVDCPPTVWTSLNRLQRVCHARMVLCVAITKWWRSGCVLVPDRYDRDLEEKVIDVDAINPSGENLTFYYQGQPSANVGQYSRATKGSFNEPLRRLWQVVVKFGGGWRGNTIPLETRCSCQLNNELSFQS